MGLALPGMQVTMVVQWFLAKKLCEAIQFINVESYPWKHHWSLVNPNSLRKVWSLVLFFL